MDFYCLLASVFKQLIEKMVLIFHGEIQRKQDKLSVNLEILLFKDSDVYIAYSPALDISAFGDTEESAKDEFGKTMKAHLEYCLNKRTLFDDLRAHGWKVKSKKRIQAPSQDYLMEKNDTYKEIRNNKAYRTINEEIAIARTNPRYFFNSSE